MVYLFIQNTLMLNFHIYTLARDAATRVKAPSGFNWWRLVKQPRALKDLVLRNLALAVGRFTPMWVTCIVLTLRAVSSLAKTQGPKGLVKHLKVLFIVTQQAAGGHLVRDLTSLGARVARTSKGIPRIIHPKHREEILAGKASTVRLYLTLFGIYRVIEYTGTVNIGSITGLCLMKQRHLLVLARYIPSFWLEIAKMVSGRKDLGGISLDTLKRCTGYRDELDENPTLRATRILPITLSGPLSGPVSAGADPLWLKYDTKAEARKVENTDGRGFLLGLWRGIRPSEVPLFNSLAKRLRKSTATNVGTLFFTVSRWMSSGLLPILIEWVRLYDIKTVKDLFRNAYTVRFAQINPWGPRGWETTPPGDRLGGLGKLAFLPESAGKIRVVAMVDCITQSLLKPLHDWIFSILKCIPQDGTFDQVAPIWRLRDLGYKELYSYDLSSATDRLPLVLQETLLGYIIGEKAARLWATLLVGRSYEFSARTARKYGLRTTSVKYACGQPMGAYSSWAMLALTHHLLVQIAAWQALKGRRGWFPAYAVLGDDIVIANKVVARKYLWLMTKVLRVNIQESKSLISNNGTFEFAKRTVVRGTDATPISQKGFLAGLRNLACMEGVLAKVPGIWECRISDILRAYGYGYKVLGRLQSILEHRSRARGLLVFLSRPGGLLGTNLLDWLYKRTPGTKGEPVKYGTNWRILQSYLAVVENLLQVQLKAREGMLSRKASGPGFIPTTILPTRTLFDLAQKWVLRPAAIDLKNRMAELEVAFLEAKRLASTDLDSREQVQGEDPVMDVSSEDLVKWVKMIDAILAEISSLPKDAKVFIRRNSNIKVPRSRAIKSWERLRRLVRWE